MGYMKEMGSRKFYLMNRTVFSLRQLAMVGFWMLQSKGILDVAVKTSNFLMLCDYSMRERT